MRSRLVGLGMALIVLAGAGGGSGCRRRAEPPGACPEVPAGDAGKAGPPAGRGAPAPARAAAAAAEAEARAFLEREYVPTIERLERVMNLAGWNSYVFGAQDFYKARQDAEVLLRRFHADRVAFERVRAWKDAPEIADPVLHRQLELVHLQYLENQVDPELAARIVERSTRLEEGFNTFRADFRGAKRTDSDLREILRTTTSADEAREAWEALKQVGPLVAEDLVALAELRNEAARQVGFDDFYALQLAAAEQTPEAVAELLGRVEAMTDEPFRALKAELDAEAAARFNLAVDELRPWHYGDPFFQQAPPVPGLDPDAVWKGRDILALARRFYAGIGLDVGPVLDRSDVFERPGKVQHAFCFDIDRAGDVRVLLNLRSDARWAETTLHELGHAVYDVGIDPELPYVLRGPAHTLATEGVAMMFGALSADPAWIAAVVGQACDEALAGKLRRQRVRDGLVFARWAIVMTEFERGLYADPRRDLGALWWGAVERLQLLVRPAERTAPDWATKIHLVSSPVYYHNYLLGELFAAQLRERMAREVLRAGDPAEASFAGCAEIGPWLRDNVFRPGRTLRWDAFVERATGRPLGPEAFVARME